MFCPRCGQQQISNETRFCSRCGFLMTGLAEVVAEGGLMQQLGPDGTRLISPRRKGLKQGGALFLLGVFVVPLVAILSTIINYPKQFVGLAAVLLFLGGFLRMVYALIFESGNPADKTLEENVFQTAQKLLKKKPEAGELPPSQTIPTSAYMPPRQVDWRDTNDLEPSSITESTTKLLQKDE